jgi:uncharacterized protein (TIGR02284 family)
MFNDSSADTVCQRLLYLCANRAPSAAILLLNHNLKRSHDMPQNKQILDTLEDLIQISRDGQHGYRDASEHAKNPELKRLLNEVSLERAKFAGDLELEAVRWGRADVDRNGTALGAVHRGWTDLKAALGGGDDAILSSIETGDELARRRYDEAIRSDDMPEDITGVLRNQAQAIVGTLDRIRALRRRRAA